MWTYINNILTICEQYEPVYRMVLGTEYKTSDC